MNRPRRSHAEARAQMREGILRLGNEQLAEVGAPALSVREIARGLGVASSAIYRHVANRDELLTLLIVDAYGDLAKSALDEVDQGAPAGQQLAAIATGMRRWATANPARWALAYGSPVPGYSAPADQTNGPGTLVMTTFLRALSLGKFVRPASVPKASPSLRSELLAGAAEIGIDADPELGVTALGAWTGLIGLISAEVFQQLGAELASHGEELLERWIAETVARFDLS